MDIGKFGFPVGKDEKPKLTDRALVYNRIPAGMGKSGAGRGGGNSGGGGGGRKLSASGSLAEALLEEEWDLEFPALALPEIPLNPAKEVCVTLTAKWNQDKGFFNDKAVAAVEAVVPEGKQHLTRVVIRLYALHPDGKRELIQTKEASLSGGRVFCELDLFISSFREDGEPPKTCEYVFTAEHAHSKETESPRLKGEARPMGWLRLKLEKAYQGPLANRACTLKVAGEEYDLTTDDKGVLSKFIPADATEAEITVHADDAHPKPLKLNVAIENLDPPDQPEGSRDRLDSMGYAPGAEDEHPIFRKAVEEFQCDSGLSATGKMDATTQGKLKEAFGC